MVFFCALTFSSVRSAIIAALGEFDLVGLDRLERRYPVGDDGERNEGDLKLMGLILLTECRDYAFKYCLAHEPRWQ